jgi:hypothetical protein
MLRKPYNSTIKALPNVELEPLNVADNLVKGTILAAYDFVQLTFAGIAIPFLRFAKHTKRLWFSIRDINKRFSSLTFLFVWVTVTVAAYIQPSDLELAFTGKFDKSIV